MRRTQATQHTSTDLSSRLTHGSSARSPSPNHFTPLHTLHRHSPSTQPSRPTLSHQLSQQPPSNRPPVRPADQTPTHSRTRIITPWVSLRCPQPLLQLTPTHPQQRAATHTDRPPPTPPLSGHSVEYPTTRAASNCTLSIALHTVLDTQGAHAAEPNINTARTNATYVVCNKPRLHPQSLPVKHLINRTPAAAFDTTLPTCP